MREELLMMKRSWPQDVLAGITVAIVALPLALGFGVTSGAGAASGITTAIIAGLVTAVFGGSRYQVSGPTGAMTVVLVPIIASFGMQALLAVSLIAGISIIAFSALKLGRFMEKIPWSVAEGFTLGIALVIALQQLPLIFDADRGEGRETLVVAWNTLAAALHNGVNVVSVGIVVLTLAIKLAWSAAMRRAQWTFTFPASAVAVIVVTTVVAVFRLPVARIGTLPASELFHINLSWPDIDMFSLLYAGLAVAFLGAIESLLSARVADSMAATRDAKPVEHHRPNRELFGQGLATLASALFGGMPATGAIARTSVNIHAGATTRLSSITHAIALVVMVFALGWLVSEIPTAALAGVLLGTSWRIANPRSVAESLRTTVLNKVTFVVTAVAVVTIDLIWGTVIGVIVHVLGTVIEKKRRSKLAT